MLYGKLSVLYFWSSVVGDNIIECNMYLPMSKNYISP